MWLFTTVGFFSVVQKPGETDLTVRARARDDLERLREGYLPELSQTVAGGGTDYPYRAKVSHEALARGAAKLVRDVSYPNFKNEVARVADPERAHVYSEVWHALLALEGDG